MTVLLSRFVAIADVAGIYRVPQFPLCIASPHLKCCLTSAFHSSLMLAVFMISCKSEYSSRVFIKASKPSRIGISPARRRNLPSAGAVSRRRHDSRQVDRRVGAVGTMLGKHSRECGTHFGEAVRHTPVVIVPSGRSGRDSRHRSGVV